MDPLHITEFASEKYFEKLKQLNDRAENASSSSSAGPAAAATVSAAIASTYFHSSVRATTLS